MKPHASIELDSITEADVGKLIIEFVKRDGELAVHIEDDDEIIAESSDISITYNMKKKNAIIITRLSFNILTDDDLSIDPEKAHKEIMWLLKLIGRMFPGKQFRTTLELC